tara:strand:- start:164 stop:274 length:111 start_codon:yes stop_codon:yes gene_type:complete
MKDYYKIPIILALLWIIAVLAGGVVLVILDAIFNFV